MVESSKKIPRKETEKALKEKKKKWSLVVERGVKVSDLKGPAFAFIFDIF